MPIDDVLGSNIRIVFLPTKILVGGVRLPRILCSMVASRQNKFANLSRFCHTVPFSHAFIETESRIHLSTAMEDATHEKKDEVDGIFNGRAQIDYKLQKLPLLLVIITIAGVFLTIFCALKGTGRSIENAFLETESKMGMCFILCFVYYLFDFATD